RALPYDGYVVVRHAERFGRRRFVLQRVAWIDRGEIDDRLEPGGRDRCELFLARLPGRRMKVIDRTIIADGFERHGGLLRKGGECREHHRCEEYGTHGPLLRSI